MAVKKINMNVRGIVLKELERSERTREAYVRNIKHYQEEAALEEKSRDRKFHSHWIRMTVEQKKRVEANEEHISKIRKILDDDYWRLSDAEPVHLPKYLVEKLGYDFWVGRIAKIDHDKTWLYQNCLFNVEGNYTQEQMKLLVLEEADKDRKKFERLKSKFDSEASHEIKY